MRRLRGLVVTTILALGAGTAHARDNIIIANRAEVSDDLDLISRAWPGASQMKPADLLKPFSGGLEVIYYSGPVARDAGGISLPDPAGAVKVAPFLGGRAGRTVMLINSCGTNMSVGASDFVASGDWLVVFPASGANCLPQTFAQAALTALESPPEDWAAAFGRAGLGVARPRAATDPATIPILQQVQNDSIVISTVRPTDGPRIVAQEVAARPADIPRAIPAGAAPIIDTPGDRSVRPVGAGLPQPSIIVGEQAQSTTRPEFARTAQGVSIEDRTRIRQESPETFTQLLAEGAFDPDAAQMAAAIQTELRRMSCYPGTVDGLWGAGSNAAVGRFVAKAGGQAASAQPTAALYRQIIGVPETVCDPVAATPTTARPNTARGNNATPSRTPSRGTSQSRPRNGGGTTQPRQPARGTGTTPRIAPSISGSGMFR